MLYLVLSDRKWYLNLCFSGLITSVGKERDGFSAVSDSFLVVVFCCCFFFCLKGFVFLL